MPSATLRKGQQILTIKKVNVKGTVHQRGARTIVSVTELDSVYPQLAISGKLSADQASSQTSVELNSSEVDVESVRRTVLFLAGRVPAVRSVFEILKKGRVPGLNLTSRGSTIHDLAREENIVIKGSITGGNIFLRGPAPRPGGRQRNCHDFTRYLRREKYRGPARQCTRNKGAIEVRLKRQDCAVPSRYRSQCRCGRTPALS